MQLIQINKLVI